MSADPVLRAPRAVSAALACLMVVQVALGRAFPAAYRDVDWIRATWIGNDWLTLLLGTPVLVAGLVLSREGAARGVLLWLGGLGYALYNYMFYLVGAALNAFLPLYCLLVLLSVAGLILALARINVSAIAGAAAPWLPSRLVGGYLVVLGTGLCLIWLVMWALHIFAGQPAPGGEEAFKIVAALDITLMVPALTLGGILMWRGEPWGIVIAAIATIQAALYLTVLATNAVIQIRLGFAEAPGEVPLWIALAVPTWIAMIILVAAAQGGRDDTSMR